jgi:hypothetical protein
MHLSTYLTTEPTIHKGLQMNVVVFTLLVLFSVSSMAENINASGLTDVQKAQIALEVENIKRSNEQSKIPKPDKVDNAISTVEKIGPVMSKVVGETAKELSIAANEFVTTPVGIMVAILVFYHFVGTAIFGFIKGLLILSIGIWLTMYIARQFERDCVSIKTEYSPDKTDIFKRPVKVREVRESLDSEEVAGIAIIRIVGSVISLIVFLILLI